MKNPDVKNWLRKEDATNDLFGILVFANVNAINHVTQDNIWTIKIANVGKKWLVSSLKNVVKILTEMKWFIMRL